MLTALLYVSLRFLWWKYGNTVAIQDIQNSIGTGFEYFTEYSLLDMFLSVSSLVTLKEKGHDKLSQCTDLRTLLREFSLMLGKKIEILIKVGWMQSFFMTVTDSSGTK